MYSKIRVKAGELDRWFNRLCNYTSRAQYEWNGYLQLLDKNGNTLDPNNLNAWRAPSRYTTFVLTFEKDGAKVPTLDNILAWPGA